MPELVQPLSESDAHRGPPQTASASRIPELEALRAFGALAVLGSHLWPSAFYFGWTRAEFFFVLSGYLITSIILRHGSRRRFLYVFWARRALRIWPAYYLLMVIMLFYTFFNDRLPRLGCLVAHLTFAQNLPYYWSDTAPGFSTATRQTWSLAIEEQFYLAWPVIIHLIGRPRILQAALWLIVTSLVSRLCGLPPAVILARCDGLALGAILAVLLGDGSWARRRIARLRLIFALVGMVALAFFLAPLPEAKSIPHYALGSGPLSILAAGLIYFSIIGLVICHAGHPALALLRIRLLNYLGRISYGIFLYHLIIIEIVIKAIGARSIGSDLVVLPLSVLAGAISWQFLERPINNFKYLFKY
jgi:peptidoglycan/LPS O-acetylase OafA/YrhL